jgi:hypothetical protein
VLWLLELQIRRGWKVQTQVHTANSNSRTRNCQCSLLSKKNPIIQISCVSGWLGVPINPDKWSSAKLQCGPDSSVGIATGYGLDGPGIES